MPVTMPGSAIGRMTRHEIVSRPKKLERATAAAASDPEHQRDAGREQGDQTDRGPHRRISPCPTRRRTTFVVSPGGGKVNAELSVLNA